MYIACTEKFKQNIEARNALFSTAGRYLIHKVRKDSVIIPGAIFSDILMRVRAELRKNASYVKNYQNSIAK